MDVQLIDLPQVCLEEIFKKLSFAEISQLGATCRFFREISKTIFRLYFKNIEDVIDREMEKLEDDACQQANLTVAQHLHMALLHSVLRILLSEAKMLNAHCWRYMKDSTYDFCFPAGVILDEFERILRYVRNKTLEKDMEPEITTTLFHLGETFYDYFDFKIENHFHQSSDLKLEITSEMKRKTFLPSLYNFMSGVTRESVMRQAERNLRKRWGERFDDDVVSTGVGSLVGETQRTMFDRKPKMSIHSDTQSGTSAEKTLFGVKILDILNCCASCNYNTLLLHNYINEGFKLKTDFDLRDINVLETLPTIGIAQTTSERQLIKICRYVRNNVRWTNLFHPLQDLWKLEDAIEITSDVETASALLRHWKLQRTSKFPIENTVNISEPNYRKVINRFKNRFGLLVTASLECPTIYSMPLKIQKTLDNTRSPLKEQSFDNLSEQSASFETGKFINPVQQINMEKWEGSISTYKFHLELKIQYPSFLSETVREAILKVDQIGEETTVTTEGDDMRKSATYRVDDEKYD